MPRHSGFLDYSHEVPAAELLRRLEDRFRTNSDLRGSAYVCDALKAAHDDRTVMPKQFRMLPIYSMRGPVPMREDWWRRMAYTRLEFMGLRNSTVWALGNVHIHDAAQLLLHTEWELLQLLRPYGRVDAWRYVGDVRNVLKVHNLRFATEEELGANHDFFVTLRASDEAEDPSMEIRMATFMLHELEMDRVRQLFGEHDPWPYEAAGLVTLGDLLALTVPEVVELWRGFCGRERVREWPYGSDKGVEEMFERVRREGVAALTEFLRRNGLTLAD